MRRVICLLILLLVVGATAGQEIGHRTTRYGFAVDVKPALYCDAYLRYTGPDWQAQLCTQLLVQYDLLQFTRVEQVYQAAYDVSVLIRSSADSASVFSTGWRELVTETDFETTNSSRLYHHDNKVFNLPLAAGTYHFFLELTDQTTRRISVLKSKLIVPDLHRNSITTSEIKLLSISDSLSAEIHIGDRIPIIEFDRPVLADFYLGPDKGDSLTIVSYLLTGAAGEEKIVRTQTYHLLPATGITVFREWLDKEILEEGRHILRYIIRAGSHPVQLQKEFTVIWYEKPVYLYEFDLALRPMEAIMPAAEWKKVKNLSGESKKKWFDDFWRAKDPTPATPLNEIQFEFYRRVDMANARYGLRFREGWQTDRGQALLSQGMPDSVETFRYSASSKPYEVWFYYSLKKKLTFVDYDKDENYKLSAIEDLEETKHE